jgi:hypothetical protein
LVSYPQCRVQPHCIFRRHRFDATKTRRTYSYSARASSRAQRQRQTTRFLAWPSLIPSSIWTRPTSHRACPLQFSLAPLRLHLFTLPQPHTARNGIRTRPLHRRHHGRLRRRGLVRYPSRTVPGVSIGCLARVRVWSSGEEPVEAAYGCLPGRGAL